MGEGGTLDQTWLLNDLSIALDEQGNPLLNDGGTRHDILTGSNADGTVSASGTCSDTSRRGPSARAADAAPFSASRSTRSARCHRALCLTARSSTAHVERQTSTSLALEDDRSL